MLFCKDFLLVPPYFFTGTMTREWITVDGVRHELITLLSNGTFISYRARNAKIWLCGSGAGGSGLYGNGGGAGGYFVESEITFLPGETHQVTIGAPTYYRGESTSFGALTALGGGGKLTHDQSYRDGGSGGGKNGSLPPDTNTYGIGDGISTIPFGDSVNFTPHCAGGGGHWLVFRDTDGIIRQYRGGDGGTDGGNGDGYSLVALDPLIPGNGGNYGGGRGGGWNQVTSEYFPGQNAYNYGCGGGAGPTVATGSGWDTSLWGKSYQGVVYILSPDP